MGDSTHGESGASIAGLLQNVLEELRLLRMDVAEVKAMMPQETKSQRRSRLEPAAILACHELAERCLRSGENLTRRAIAEKVGVAESTLRQWTGEGSFDYRFRMALASVRTRKVVFGAAVEGETEGEE